jgi:hypothetical protein
VALLGTVSAVLTTVNVALPDIMGSYMRSLTPWHFAIIS